MSEVPKLDTEHAHSARLVDALPGGSYLVLAHPTSDIRAASMAEMTRRVNQRISGPQATMRDRAAITRFFDGLEFEPVKLNYLTLGNTVPHLHTHVVPRYRDDPAPGGPIEWTQMFSADPVADAELRRQAAALRVLLAS